MDAIANVVGKVKKDEQLMLARDGSDRLEAIRGPTSITVGVALVAGGDGEVWSYIVDKNPYLSKADKARLKRAAKPREG